MILFLLKDEGLIPSMNLDAELKIWTDLALIIAASILKKKLIIAASHEKNVKMKEVWCTE